MKMYKPIPTVTLVHGAFDHNGVLTTDKLRPYLETEGWTVEEFDTGFTGLLGVRFLNHYRAMQLEIKATKLKKESAGELVGIGHSNGCAILAAASELGAPFDRLVFLNPALDRDAAVGPSVRRVDVFHSPSDIPIYIAGLFLKHPWGRMGRNGSDGSDPRFVNHNMLADYPVKVKGHLDIFKQEKLAFYGQIIASLLNE